MKLSRLVIAIAFVVPVAGGCKKSEPKSDPVGSAGSGTAAGTGSGTGTGTATGSGSGSGSGSDAAGSTTTMSKMGGNCPSLVAGATTKITVDEKKGSVTVAITATDKNAIVTIQERANTFADRDNQPGPGTVHDGKGSKGGVEGACAVGAPGLEVYSVKNDGKGTTMVLTLTADAQKSADKAKIFAEVQARADKGAEWVKANLKLEPGGQGGTGDGGGKHGRDHSGKGDMKGKDGTGTGGGNQDGTGGGGGKGTGGGGGSGSGSAK